MKSRICPVCGAAFNRRTLRPDMDEAAEHARYAAIAGLIRRCS